LGVPSPLLTSNKGTNMTFEYLAKADEGLIVVGIICGVLAMVFKYMRIREKGTVLFPKKSSEENKKNKSIL
jgi:hypothetical protein